MLREIRFGSVALAAFSCVACESILGVDFGAAKLDTRDASLDSPASSAPGPCNPLEPPGRVPLDPATDAVTFTVVVRTIDYGDEAPEAGVPGYFSLGYDLDQSCTNKGLHSSCTPQPWIGSVASDGPRGQDDAVGRLMLAEKATFGQIVVGSRLGNDDVAQGIDAPVGVIRVSDFSGLSEDDHVEVDWFVPAPPVHGDGGALTSPRFDATDHWPILATSVTDSAATAANAISVHRDAQAFVHKNALVAHFDATDLPLRNVYFGLLDVVLTGQPHRNLATNAWTIENGTVAAHAKTNELLGVVPTIAKAAFGVDLCVDNKGNYPAVKRFICSSSDLPDPIGAPVETPCTQTSLGASFTTAPASLGAIVPAPAPLAFCTPLTDPAKDTCATAPAGD